mmetsp:Transcript_10128/g.17833  ORF Transcript_10128/g.17833 Transcript_10128/m.17833 type:complete len:116 (-) Transcript_10128:431-778(-)
MEDKSEQDQLSADYHACVLSHWKYCAAGVLVTMPVAMYKKSHVFWAIGGITGTLMDFAEAVGDCKPYADAIRANTTRVHRDVTLKEVSPGLDNMLHPSHKNETVGQEQQFPVDPK